MNANHRCVVTTDSAELSLGDADVWAMTHTNFTS